MELNNSVKDWETQVKRENTGLRGNDDKAMRSDVLDKLRVERVGEKETMEKKQHWEFSSFTRQANQKRLRRRNRNTWGRLGAAASSLCCLNSLEFYPVLSNLKNI